MADICVVPRTMAGMWYAWHVVRTVCISWNIPVYDNWQQGLSSSCAQQTGMMFTFSSHSLSMPHPWPTRRCLYAVMTKGCRPQTCRWLWDLVGRYTCDSDYSLLERQKHWICLVHSRAFLSRRRLTRGSAEPDWNTPDKWFTGWVWHSPLAGLQTLISKTRTYSKATVILGNCLISLASWKTVGDSILRWSASILSLLVSFPPHLHISLYFIYLLYIYIISIYYILFVYLWDTGLLKQHQAGALASQECGKHHHLTDTLPHECCRPTFCLARGHPSNFTISPHIHIQCHSLVVQRQWWVGVVGWHISLNVTRRNATQSPEPHPASWSQTPEKASFLTWLLSFYQEHLPTPKPHHVP